MSVHLHRPSDESPGVGAAKRHSPQLPSIIFAIPFPRPIQHRGAAAEAPPFLLYTFPRSVYQKPGMDPVTGKRGKEKLIKKLERKWQEEVKHGQEMKDGRHNDAGRFKRSKGAVVRFASATIQRLPNNVLEVLARLPPPKKIGQVSIIYPDSVDLPWFNVAGLSDAHVEKSFWAVLAETKKKATRGIVLSGCLLPVTLAIDILVIVPVFLFEINLAYFATQLNGSRKAKYFVEASKRAGHTTSESHEHKIDSTFEFKANPGSWLDGTMIRLYSICSTLDPIRFPSLEQVPPLTHTPPKEIASDLIQIFKESLDSDVTARHVLDEELVALDLDRALRKAAREYVHTLAS